MRRRMLGIWLALAVPGIAVADCVDINADPPERLREIVHVDAVRAAQIVGGRPWPAVDALIALRGIGRARLRDMLEQGLACVGVRAPAGARAVVVGSVRVVDADTLVVGDRRVRLIGIDAPERDQSCGEDGERWACGALATTAVAELVGEASLACEVYGLDRYDRALAVCRSGDLDLNAEIVRAGWALAWYPETGAVRGPDYAAEEAEAQAKLAGIWQGTFVEPSLVRNPRD